MPMIRALMSKLVNLDEQGTLSFLKILKFTFYTGTLSFLKMLKFIFTDRIPKVKSTYMIILPLHFKPTLISSSVV